MLVNDLASLDPVQSTAVFVRNHGFLVYDQLFALDSHGDPKPEMVDTSDKSEDGRIWRFTLRPGLLFHDNTPSAASMPSPASSAGGSATSSARP